MGDADLLANMMKSGKQKKRTLVIKKVEDKDKEKLVEENEI